MTRSFLNIVTVDGRLCRVAEFGFFADMPSFDGNGIIFRTGGKYKRIDLDTGMISDSEAVTDECKTSPDSRYTVRVEFESTVTDGRGYADLILRDNEKSTVSVLTRFMGSEASIGKSPFSDDSVSIAFFGYPENELG